LVVSETEINENKILKSTFLLGHPLYPPNMTGEKSGSQCWTGEQQGYLSGRYQRLIFVHSHIISKNS
jgi:hypothetical protein